MIQLAHWNEETKEIGIVYDRDANLLTVSNAAIDILRYRFVYLPHANEIGTRSGSRLGR